MVATDSAAQCRLTGCCNGSGPQQSVFRGNDEVTMIDEGRERPSPDQKRVMILEQSKARGKVQRIEMENGHQAKFNLRQDFVPAVNFSGEVTSHPVSIPEL